MLEIVEGLFIFLFDTFKVTCPFPKSRLRCTTYGQNSLCWMFNYVSVIPRITDNTWAASQATKDVIKELIPTT